MTNWTEEQKEAIYKDGTNIIVSAGAGSGKTAVLSERVIQKLKKGININELLILTFTKAAAFEMKERIRNKINDDEKLKDQLDLIDTAYITTFDSFALSIVKKYHYLYNISTNVNIVEDNVIAIKKQMVINEIFEKRYQNKDTNFIKLIDDLTIKNDKEIKKLILNISNKLDMKLDKQEYLDTYIDTYYSHNKINDNILEYEKLLITKIDNIKNNLDLIMTYSNEYYTKIYESLLPLLNSTNYEEIKNNSNTTLPRLPSNSTYEVKQLKENIASTLKDISDMTQYEDKKSMIDKYELTKPYVEAIISILKDIDDKISKYKIENDLYEFSDIALLAIKMVRENETVREELKNSFKEIMIDEYQDTNDLQETLIDMISDNNTYVVGDIKQSIYKFRNANPINFKNKYDNYKKGKNGYKIDLNKNFRSRKEIIKDINTIFNKIMDDNYGKADYIKEHQMSFGNTSYEENKIDTSYGLQIYDYEPNDNFDKTTIESFIIANDIVDKIKNHYQVFDKELKKLREVTYDDFVILIDRSSKFEIIKKILEYHNIPTSIEKNENITNETEILVIRNLLNMIIKIKKEQLDNEFKYSFVSVARSFIMNYPDDKIFKFFTDSDFKNNELYKKAYLISLKIDSYSIKHILQEIIDMFDLYNKLPKIGDSKSRTIRIDYLFKLSDTLSDLGYNIYDYTTYLSDMITSENKIEFKANTLKESSVKITTIHKSKGLEYHICYFPGFDKKFNLDDVKGKIIYDEKYGIITPYFSEGIGTTFYKYLVINKSRIEEISERIRLLYVALTRARENMIIVTSLKEKLTSKDENGVIDENTKLNYMNFNDMISSTKEYISDLIVPYDLSCISINNDYRKVKKVNYKKYIPNIETKIIEDIIDTPNEYITQKRFSKNSNKLTNKEEKKNMELGLYMHYLLEMIDFKNPNLEGLNIKNMYYEKIMKFLNSDIMKNAKNADIYKEYEFMYVNDENEYHGIIDLLLVYSDHVDVIDYKLKNTNDEAYIEQLKGYKYYIENKLHKKTNTYLYSIIDGIFKEI